MKPLLFFPAIGIGLLTGFLLPVKKEAPAAGNSSRPPRERPAAPPLVFEIPATDAEAWAAKCAEAHPQEFYKWLLKQDPQPAPDLVRAFFHAWIQRDPDAAFTAALELPARFGFAPMTEASAFDPVADGGFFIKEIWGLMDSDPAASFRWIGRVEGVLGAFGAMNFVVPFEDHPELKQEDVAQWVNGSQAGQFTETMINSYSRFLLEKRGLDDAVRWLQSLNVEHQSAALEAVATAWGKADPAGALKFLQEAPSAIRQPYSASILVSSAFASSPKEGLDWLAENMGITSYSGLCNLLESFAYKDPQGAFDYVSALEPGPQRTEALNCLGSTRAYSGATAPALKWIATLPAEVQMDVMGGALAARGDNDFPAFLGTLADASLAPENQQSYFEKLVPHLSGAMGWDKKGDIAKWFQENPGDVRDAFFKAGAAALEKSPEGRNMLLSYLPPAEVQRILGPQP